MFALQWTEEAQKSYRRLATKAQQSLASRTRRGSKKSSKVAGLFKQVHKTLQLLRDNPRHPGLRTHEYRSPEHPYDPQPRQERRRP